MFLLFQISIVNSLLKVKEQNGNSKFDQAWRKTKDVNAEKSVSVCFSTVSMS